MTRRPGQSILIGPDIEVFVVEVTGNQVRVGVNAPRKIRVLRRELVAQVEAENRRAAEIDRPTPQALRDLAPTVRTSSKDHG